MADPTKRQTATTPPSTSTPASSHMLPGDGKVLTDGQGRRWSLRADSRVLLEGQPHSDPSGNPSQGVAAVGCGDLFAVKGRSGIWWTLEASGFFSNAGMVDPCVRAPRSPSPAPPAPPTPPPSTQQPLTPSPTPSRPQTSATWMEMVVQQHPRVFPIFRNPDATDSAKPQASDYVPNRAWSAPVRVAPREYRFHGGAHTDYPGNDVDRVVLDLVQMKVTVTQLRRPKVPPASNSMYGAGGGPPIDLGDGTFEPTTIHGWGRQSYVPGVGYVFFNNNMVGGRSRFVLNRYNEDTNRFEALPTVAAPAGRPIGSQLLEWDDTTHSLPILWGDEHGTSHVHEYKPAQGIIYVRSISTNLVGFGDQSGGISRVYLGSGTHLLYRPSTSNLPGREARLLHYNHVTGAIAPVSIPDYAVGRSLSLAVDRASGVVYAGFKAVDRPRDGSATLGIMRCEIGTLGRWTRLEFANAPTWGNVGNADGDPDGALQRQPLWVEDGHLVLIDFISKQWVNDYWMKTRFFAVPLKSG